MIIAKNKKRDNIAEYILYMWQVEDMIRSVNLDIDVIYSSLINNFDINETDKAETKKWYEDIIEEMRTEGIEKEGHLGEVREVVGELTLLHQSLLTIYQNKEFIQLYNTAQPNIEELMKKSKGTGSNEVLVCLNGLYGLFILKLQKKKVSKETTEAMQTFSRMLAYLSVKYKEMKKGELSLHSTVSN
jgi:uncharacterized protein DUF4924